MIIIIVILLLLLLLLLIIIIIIDSVLINIFLARLTCDKPYKMFS